MIFNHQLQECWLQVLMRICGKISGTIMNLKIPYINKNFNIFDLVHPK